MSISVKVHTFEGPLDLLLHLIKKAEVDIYDIPILEITDQYISYLEDMEQLDMDLASEFILMAATLIEIKSQMLLPKKKREDEEGEEIDPRKALVEKLIEYKKYKGFAGVLKEIENDNIVFFKTPDIIDDIKDEEIFFKNITVENVMTAFKRVMDSFENRYNKRSEIPENIRYDEYKIEDKMQEIKDILTEHHKVKFEFFFEYAISKMELIVIFLAMLELMKLRHVKVIQAVNYGEILIEGRESLWSNF